MVRKLEKCWVDKRVVIWEGPYNLGSKNCRPCSRWGRQITSGYMGTRAQLGGISQRSPRAVSGAGTWPPERGARRQVPEAVRASAGTKCHHLGGGTSTNRSVFSHRSGGQTSKSQVWAGPLSIPGSGHSPSLPLPPFFLLVGSLARSDVTPICLCGHTPSPLWVPMSSPGASPAHVSLLLLQGHPLHGVEGPPSSRVISSSPVTSATIRFPIRSHSGVLGVRT